MLMMRLALPRLWKPVAIKLESINYTHGGREPPGDGGLPFQGNMPFAPIGAK